jgi:hypothetical protein
LKKTSALSKPHVKQDLEEVNPRKATKVINESNKVFVMSMRNNRCNPPNITMNNIKTFGGTRWMMRKR